MVVAIRSFLVDVNVVGFILEIVVILEASCCFRQCTRGGEIIKVHALTALVFVGHFVGANDEFLAAQWMRCEVEEIEVALVAVRGRFVVRNTSVEFDHGVERGWLDRLRCRLDGHLLCIKVGQDRESWLLFYFFDDFWLGSSLELEEVLVGRRWIWWCWQCFLDSYVRLWFGMAFDLGHSFDVQVLGQIFDLWLCGCVQLCVEQFLRDDLFQWLWWGLRPYRLCLVFGSAMQTLWGWWYGQCRYWRLLSYWLFQLNTEL